MPSSSSSRHHYHICRIIIIILIMIIIAVVIIIIIIVFIIIIGMTIVVLTIVVTVVWQPIGGKAATHACKDAAAARPHIYTHSGAAASHREATPSAFLQAFPLTKVNVTIFAYLNYYFVICLL
jgi:hypothetical protein